MAEETETEDSTRHVSLSLQGGTNTWVGKNNVSYHFLSGDRQIKSDLAAFTQRQHVTQDQQGLTEGSNIICSELADNPQSSLAACDPNSNGRTGQQITEDNLSGKEDEIDVTDTAGEQKRNIRLAESDFQEQTTETVDQQASKSIVQYSEKRPSGCQGSLKQDTQLQPQPHSTASTGSSKSTLHSLPGIGIPKVTTSSGVPIVRGASVCPTKQDSDESDSDVQPKYGLQSSAVVKDSSSLPVHAHGAPDVDSSDGSGSQSDWEGWSDWEEDEGNTGTPDNNVRGGGQIIINQPDINIRNVMIGDNTVLIKIGDDVIRHRTVGNIEFEMKIQKLQQQTEIIDGRRRIKISIELDEFPTAELAAIEALRENNNLCSRIRQAFSKMAATVWNFRNGSIILELEPESETTVQQLFKAVDDGSFDDIIIDILKQEQVLKHITEKKVKVSIDICVPKQVTKRHNIQISESGVSDTKNESCAGRVVTKTEDLIAAKLEEEMKCMRRRLMEEEMGLMRYERNMRSMIETVKTKTWNLILHEVCMLCLMTMLSLALNLILTLFIKTFLTLITGELVAKVIGMSVCSFMSGHIGSELEDPNIQRGTIGGSLLGAVLGACLGDPPAGPLVMILTWTGIIILSSALGDIIGDDRWESVLAGVVVGLTAFDITGGVLKALTLGVSIFAGRFTDNKDAASVVRSVIAAAAVGSFIGPLGTAVLALSVVGSKMFGDKVVALMVPLVILAFFKTKELIIAFDQIGTSLGIITSAVVLGMLGYNKYWMHGHDRSTDILAYGGAIGLALGSTMFTRDESALVTAQKETIGAILIGGILADLYIQRSSSISTYSNRNTLVLSIIAGSLIGCAFGLVAVQPSVFVANFVLRVTSTVTSFLYNGVELLLYVYVKLVPNSVKEALFSITNRQDAD